MPAVLMVHEEDPAERIWRIAGNLDEVDVFNNQVLVGVYQREAETKTKSGLILAHQTTDEDRFQSKVGLILKMGNGAFYDPTERWFVEQDMFPGNWVVFRPSSGWNLTLISQDKNGKKQELLCRMVDDTAILGRVSDPDRVY